jgi:ABC-type multidrug transport system fused ATPase/permease subunit
MLEILATPPGPDVAAPATAAPSGVATPTIARRGIAGPPAIRFADVSFAYEGGRRPALRGLDLDIPAGATVALVGETGAGKSTVANLLLRFVQAGGGTITVDGVPLEAIDVADWRGSVAWVPQAPHLFTGSVADNIRLGRPEATDAQVEAAAIEAGVDGAIRSLPRGYETPLGEEGLGVSGGERQRLAIARAFLRDAPFILLDEVTSHLDRATEAEIADAVRRLARHRTVLVISHRLKLAAGADRVVVLAGGRAVEAGTPADLLALGGAYARLVATDAGAVESGR